MATRDQIRRFVEGTRPKDWYGQCAGLTYRTIKDCGGYAPDIYGSAFAAYSVTSIESKDSSKAPPGAIHYWDYYGTDDRGIVNRWGHVAVDIDGGGRNVLSATGHAHEWWGVRAGLISVASQTGRGGMVYLGWSRFYGRRNRLTIGSDSPADNDSKPFDPPPPPRRRQKEDPMLVLEISTGSGKHIALLSQGVFSHVVRDDRPDILSDITDSKRTFQIDLPYLGRLLRLWGCDRDIWDIRGGKFVVLDPLSGTVAEGNTWTAERAVRGAIAGIRLPAIDTKPLVDAVAKALADGRDYDAAEIAKAVNDEASRRLQG